MKTYTATLLAALAAMSLLTNVSAASVTVHAEAGSYAWSEWTATAEPSADGNVLDLPAFVQIHGDGFVCHPAAGYAASCDLGDVPRGASVASTATILP